MTLVNSRSVGFFVARKFDDRHVTCQNAGGYPRILYAVVCYYFSIIIINIIVKNYLFLLIKAPSVILWSDIISIGHFFPVRQTDCIDCIILYVLLEWPKIDNAPRQVFFNSEQRKQSAWT